MMGLLSGLNQRLALGIENQFVFATLQIQSSTLQVVAAIRKNQEVRFVPTDYICLPRRNGQVRIYELAQYTLACPLQMTQFYLLHRCIMDLGTKYSEAIKEKFSSSNFLPDKPNDGFMDWWPYSPSISEGASTSVGPSTLDTTTVHSADVAMEGELQDRGVSCDQGRYDIGSSILISETPLDFGDSLLALKEEDIMSKMERYFITMQDAGTPVEEFNSAAAVVLVDTFNRCS